MMFFVLFLMCRIALQLLVNQECQTTNLGSSVVSAATTDRARLFQWGIDLGKK